MQVYQMLQMVSCYVLCSQSCCPYPSPCPPASQILSGMFAMSMGKVAVIYSTKLVLVSYTVSRYPLENSHPLGS